MWRSASRSRWPVVTPGLSSDSTRARTSATIRPARRIFSISRRDLRVTISGPRPPVERPAASSAAMTPRRLVDRLAAVDRAEDAGLAVVVDDVERAAGSAAPSGPGRSPPRRPARWTSGEPSMSQMPGTLGRVRGEVVDVAVGGADPAVGHPRDELLGRDVDVDAPGRPGGRAAASAASSASAWTRVRGKPSRIAPLGASGCSSRSRKTRTIVVVRARAGRGSCSGRPRARARVPVGDGGPEQVAGRRGPARRDGSARTGAWVPFPAPGAPRRTTTVIGRRRESLGRCRQRMNPS